MLIIELKINETQIALAAVKNTSPEGQGTDDNCYDVSVTTQPNPYGRPIETRAHHIHISNHDRSESPWSLVAKIAAQLAERENGVHG